MDDFAINSHNGISLTETGQKLYIELYKG